MKKLLTLLLVLTLGCATKPQVIMLFEHPPIYPKGTIEINAGIDLFKDLRPEKEKKLTKGITDLAEEVTSMVCRDFREAELFDSIRISYNPKKVDLIIKGQINSFYWKAYVSPTTKLPYIKYIHELGITSGKGEGEVILTLTLINAKTGKEIARYKEKSEKIRKFTIYQKRSTGGETGEALRQVTEKLITDIIKDKEKILSSLHSNQS
jgi:hypothetical protein